VPLLRARVGIGLHDRAVALQDATAEDAERRAPGEGRERGLRVLLDVGRAADPPHVEDEGVHRAGGVDVIALRVTQDGRRGSGKHRVRAVLLAERLGDSREGGGRVVVERPEERAHRTGGVGREREGREELLARLGSRGPSVRVERGEAVEARERDVGREHVLERAVHRGSVAEDEGVPQGERKVEVHAAEQRAQALELGHRGGELPLGVQGLVAIERAAGVRLLHRAVLGDAVGCGAVERRPVGLEEERRLPDPRLQAGLRGAGAIPEVLTPARDGVKRVEHAELRVPDLGPLGVELVQLGEAGVPRSALHSGQRRVREDRLPRHGPERERPLVGRPCALRPMHEREIAGGLNRARVDQREVGRRGGGRGVVLQEVFGRATVAFAERGEAGREALLVRARGRQVDELGRLHLDGGRLARTRGPARERLSRLVPGADPDRFAVLIHPHARDDAQRAGGRVDPREAGHQRSAELVGAGEHDLAPGAQRGRGGRAQGQADALRLLDVDVDDDVADAGVAVLGAEVDRDAVASLDVDGEGRGEGARAAIRGLEPGVEAGERVVAADPGEDRPVERPHHRGLAGEASSLAPARRVVHVAAVHGERGHGPRDHAAHERTRRVRVGDRQATRDAVRRPLLCGERLASEK